MATTKKVTDLTLVSSVKDADLCLVHDGTGTKKANVKQIGDCIRKPVEEKIAPLIYQNAGSHNSMFRGKNLGTSVSNAQYQAISSGKFDDLYVGDYWVIEGITWRIAGFDYFYQSGDNAALTKHHAVIVPDTSLYTAQMHNTASGQYESGAANTTEGGYVGSDMYKTNLNKAKEQIKRIFAGHVVTHREHLCNAVANGRPSGGAWFDSEVELLCETMVYGTKHFSSLPDGTTIINNYNVGNAQLPLFAIAHNYVSNRQWFWLRDVVSAACFANVHNSGNCSYLNASNAFGVRPYFLIS